MGLERRQGEPDVVMACAGDVPTLETLAAVEWLRRHVPELRLRVVNVVDLMTLASPQMHPHGLDDATFDSLFTRDRPVIFAYHGYPWLIHRLTYRRRNHDSVHVHGFIEEGTTTTPFDMCVLNRLDRYHLAQAALRTVPRRLGTRGDPCRAGVAGRARRPPCPCLPDRRGPAEIRNWAWAERHGSAQPDPRRVEGDIMQGDGEIGDRHLGRRRRADPPR